jgi:hypothetical protein
MQSETKTDYVGSDIIDINTVYKKKNCIKIFWINENNINNNINIL